ncbi:L-seryl-tRNA(Ser) seleniumtransferase [Oikeobacillus pervagus]|uniref:L-seryl-tRNA(Sec) selenium transferase n=1 Tax=Oikeobacillus pervagus TaxID=1325931 RepID=A0AAJ1SWD7_9BACI|nr:L-seryl-tRNA(Sec) selenium transferase [Oikeobacillus pervagus]MDQ0214058.1 L-seryl-tRNA(Ser) seleniumtransferase [Oikeobacillus pervagus]
MKEFVRHIPPIHEIQHHQEWRQLKREFRVEDGILTNTIRTSLQEIRTQLLNESWTGPMPGTSDFEGVLFQYIRKVLTVKFSYTLRRVLNATGTVLHTNLGRARLSEESISHVVATAKNYNNLEYQISEGRRGSRHDHISTLLCEITGAEAAMVVNNNAAAVYLILTALAKNKEVVVSRGQLVEIGGSFRVSSIMEESGAKLVEVGTTNKTHLRDFEQAITEECAMVMKVHTSNFVIKGFTAKVDSNQLAKLCKKKQVLFYEDLGSGLLYDLQSHGIGKEPTVMEVLQTGVDVVSFSGDKLLGGPQAGIIIGKKTIIDRLKHHQLARVVRVDKMTLAALEGTLMHYVKGEIKKIPTFRSLFMKPTELYERSSQFLQRLAEENITGRVKEEISQVGGGTMPDVEIPTFVLALQHPQISAQEWEKNLRMGDPAVIVRIQREEVILDLRTIEEGEEEELLFRCLVETV